MDVRTLKDQLKLFGRKFNDRSVVVGGRWDVVRVSVAGDLLGALELDLEGMELDDLGRASLDGLIRYVGELPEYLTLGVADRAGLIALLLPSTRSEALALAMAAVDARTAG
jgi:hypothetical protein